MVMENLLYEVQGTTGILTVNRPKALNALNRDVLIEMKAFLTSTVYEDNIRALIVTGGGEKAFIAGADIKQMQAMNHMEMMALCDLGQEVSLLLEKIDVVTIAAVNGFALGGGLEIALSCDFMYASDKAKVGLPEVSLGLIPGFGGTQRLLRTIGTRRAKEMIFTGKIISAQEGYDMDLINKVVPAENLIEECLAVAAAAAKNAPIAVTQAKRAINTGAALSMVDGLEVEKQACVAAFATADRYEGMTAFLEKRKADFKGE
jgi:enoyl-CoA hydratase